MTPQPGSVSMEGCTAWVSEFIESADGDWGRPGAVFCKRCKGHGAVSFMFCPWCGRKVVSVERIVIRATGSMYNYVTDLTAENEASP